MASFIGRLHLVFDGGTIYPELGTVNPMLGIFSGSVRLAKQNGETLSSLAFVAEMRNYRF